MAMEGTIGRMYTVVSLQGREWITRPHEPGEPARHVSELSEEAGFTHTRANLWRYEPGAHGRRHVHADQEETFLVLEGSMTMHLGDPPEPVRASAGELIHVSAGTPLQIVSDGSADLLVYVYGSPPDFGAEVLADAI
jgi:mannose-6-phosphate isomerase-like protein (cupin superfamily)